MMLRKLMSWFYPAHAMPDLTQQVRQASDEATQSAKKVELASFKLIMSANPETPVFDDDGESRNIKSIIDLLERTRAKNDKRS